MIVIEKILMKISPNPSKASTRRPDGLDAYGREVLDGSVVFFRCMVETSNTSNKYICWRCAEVDRDFVENYNVIFVGRIGRISISSRISE